MNIQAGTLNTGNANWNFNWGYTQNCTCTVTAGTGSYTFNNQAFSLAGASVFVPGTGSFAFNSQPYSQSGTSTFDATNVALLDFNVTFTLSGGTFTAPTCASCWTGGNITQSGGTINGLASSTYIVDIGNWPNTFDAPGVGGSLTFNNLTLNSGTNYATEGSDTVTVTGTLALTSGSLSNNGFVAAGGVTHNASFSSSNTILTISGAGTRTINLAAGGGLPGFTLNAANVTINGPASGTTTVGGAVTIQAGTLNTGNANWTFSNGYTQNCTCTVTAGTGSYTFSNQAFSLAGASVFVPGTGSFAFNSQPYSQSGTSTFDATNVALLDFNVT
ncbi:hypothetical protein HZA45_03330, partial [Candidatus Peregrinibacteria bacterium]|nr:hypothetical protein [Candidatus Peregrinibacteria bacterium]